MTSSISQDSAQGHDAHRRLRRVKRTKRVIQVLQVLTAIALFVGVWLVGFRSDASAPVLPDTATLFSLDLKIAATSDHGTVYAVEQRARPYYRILSLDTATGTTETVFTVPEDAIIYGIALSPDRETLAVSYTPDFELDGSGLWTLDLASGEFTEVVAVQTRRFLVDPVWTADGESVLASEVDRSDDDEQLAIVELGIDDGIERVIAANAVGPEVVGDELYFLQVDDDNARRSIGYIDTGHSDMDSATATTIDIGGGQFDLDHLVAGRGGVYVGVLESTDDSGLNLGTTADAHGNHDVASTWWSVELDGESSAPTAIEPIIVYDASVLDDGAIVYATLEGLAIGDGERIDLVKSRALRFVAG